MMPKVVLLAYASDGPVFEEVLSKVIQLHANMGTMVLDTYFLDGTFRPAPRASSFWTSPATMGPAIPPV